VGGSGQHKQGATIRVKFYRHDFKREKRSNIREGKGKSHAGWVEHTKFSSDKFSYTRERLLEAARKMNDMLIEKTTTTEGR